jgi:protein-S-isoprenylcysteine O-methyltransferase
MQSFRIFATVAFMLWIMVDGMAVFRYKSAVAENRDRFSLVVLMIGNMAGWWSSIGFAFSPIGRLHSVLLQEVGLLIMVAGIVLRSTAIAQLGRFHTPNVAIRSDHQLKQDGLYRYVRHPSYLGALIAFVGFSLALGNWVSILITMTIMPCIYLYRIHEEDAALVSAFGAPYREYCLRTKRLIPWLY